VLYDRKQDHLRAVEKYELALERAALQLTKLGEHPLALEIEARRQIDLELLEAGPEPFREEPYRLTSPAPNSESLNLSQPENLRRVLRQQTW
jgi:hypothetical protein